MPVQDGLLGRVPKKSLDSNAGGRAGTELSLLGPAAIFQARAARGRTDTLVVWKLDRLARSLSQLINVVEQLHQMGCGLRSLTEAIDTTTTSGRLVFHVFGALAEFERGIIRERTLAGLASARIRCVSRKLNPR